MTDPVMAGLVDRIDEMNRLAEGSPGFVWRWREALRAADVEVLQECLVPFDTDRLFFNMSVWETVDDLRRYVFDSRHRDVLRGRTQWIEHVDGAHAALWWLPARQIPMMSDAAMRLRLVQTRGPAPDAFTLTRPFPPPPPP